MKKIKKLIYILVAIGMLAFASKDKLKDLEEFFTPLITQFKEAIGDQGATDSSNQEEIDLVSVVNENVPYFTNKEKESVKEIRLSELDKKGRTGSAMMLVSTDTLPQVPREKLLYKPSGWHTYNTKENWGLTLDDGSFYLYHRCHLLAYSMSGINDEPRNLITGTWQFNNTMLEYEIKVLNYVKNTNNSVLYRVSPYFQDDELMARGVLMEATSIEDNELIFCVNIANKQDNFKINYLNGVAEYLGGNK